MGKNLHIGNCARRLCKNCKFFRRYYFVCYKIGFTEEHMMFQKYILKSLNLWEGKKGIFKPMNLQITKHFYHSNEYQDHKKCVIFEPESFHIYSYEIRRKLTKKQKEEIRNLCTESVHEKVNMNDIHVQNQLREMERTLASSFYYKTSSMEIIEGLLIISIDELIDLNNIITCGSNVMLRQKQMYTWVKKRENLNL